VLTVFDKTGIINFVCVVTRYFGGTLLGAGGLVRAYARAAKGAMEAAEPEELIISSIYEIICPYPKFDQLKYHLDKLGIEIVNVDYTDVCFLSVCVKEHDTEIFLKTLEGLALQPTNKGINPLDPC